MVAVVTTILLPMAVDGKLGLQLRPKPRSRGSEGTQLSTLLNLWSSGLGFSAALMLAIQITTDWRLATILVAANGISWAITNWLPFALVGQITAKLDAHGISDDGRISFNFPVSGQSSGTVSGFHNAAISAPQILSAAVCGAVFTVARAAGSTYGAGWVLCTGSLSSLAAAYLAVRSANSKTLNLVEPRHGSGG